MQPVGVLYQTRVDKLFIMLFIIYRLRKYAHTV